MVLIRKQGLLACCWLAFATLGSSSAVANPCGTKDAIQVLGSGGPIADDNRASSGYLIWIDGKARFLIDAGGGTFLRFAESGAQFQDLWWIGISHLHADHVADLPALLKSGYFSRQGNQGGSLPISGPGAGGAFIAIDVFLQRLFGEGMPFGYLDGYLTGNESLPKLLSTTIDTDAEQPTTVFDSRGVIIEALPVPHGIVPALAYRVRVKDRILVFAGDQNGQNPDFVGFAKNADVMVVHMPIPEGIGGIAARLHAEPSRLGKIASDAQVKVLVVSHFMQRSLRNLKENIDKITTRYDGTLVLSQDLHCIVIE